MTPQFFENPWEKLLTPEELAASTAKPVPRPTASFQQRQQQAFVPAQYQTPQSAAPFGAAQSNSLHSQSQSQSQGSHQHHPARAVPSFTPALSNAAAAPVSSGKRARPAEDEDGRWAVAG